MGSIGGSDFDFVYGERLARKLKRKRFDFWDVDINTCSDTLRRTSKVKRLDDGMNKDYKKFLKHLPGNSELRHSVREERDGGDGDGMDEDYKAFLYNLSGNSEFRRSVREERPGNSELRHSVREERDDGDGDGMDEDYKRFLYHLPGNSEFRHSVREERDDGDRSDEDDRADPQDKMFLEKLKEDGKSYVLEVDINITMSLRRKYEVEVDLDDERELPTLRKLMKVPDTIIMETKKDLRNLSRKDNIKTQDNPMYVVSKDMLDPSNNKTNAIGIERRDLLLEKDLNSEQVNHVSSETNRNNLFKVECEHGTEANIVMDEDYQTFLNLSKEEGDCMILANHFFKVECEQGTETSIVMDEDYQTLLNLSKEEGDCTVLAMKAGEQVTMADPGIFIKMQEDELQFLGSLDTGNRYEFRDKLVAKLREPYNHEEYETLCQLINGRKQMDGRHRDLRGPAALKSYSKDECNLSYLDLHMSLKRKINAVKFDRRKVLNLLRGFFFWLENLAYEDAFRPWLDPSCLEVLPRNR
ncbi:hypothetical protein ACSBR2_001329 [Camellia fascicularis]